MYVRKVVMPCARVVYTWIDPRRVGAIRFMFVSRTWIYATWDLGALAKPLVGMFSELLLALFML